MAGFWLHGSNAAPIEMHMRSNHHIVARPLRDSASLPIALLLGLIFLIRFDAQADFNTNGLTIIGNGGYFTDFDTQLNGKFECQQNDVVGPPPTITTEGQNNFVRLTGGGPINVTSLTYDINDGQLGFGANFGAYNRIVADFDFRITGVADGFGFILFDTTVYGQKEIVPRSGFTGAQVYQEPTATNSLGIGFDIHKGAGELSNNHVSLHFNNELLLEVDAGAIDLNGGNWIHAQVVLQHANGVSAVSVSLTPMGGAASTLISNYVIGNLIPYESRPHWGGRSGALGAVVDLDNLNVQYSEAVPVSYQFGFTNYATTESVPAYVYVSKVGGGNITNTVDFSTINGTAVGGTDFVSTNGTLIFTPADRIHMIRIPMINDAIIDPTKQFAVSLNNASGGAMITGTNTVVVTLFDDDDAATVGRWDANVFPLPVNNVNMGSGVVPIHLVVQPNGNLLMWDRKEATAFGGTDGDPRLWDPIGNAFGTTPKVTTYDLFCAGHTWMADGRLFVPGGHIKDGEGAPNASIYHPGSNSWTEITQMNAGRWYPTATTLANGDILVEAGTINIGLDNREAQIWQIDSQTWRTLTNAGLQHGSYPIWADYYPFMYQFPDGRVFCAGPQQMARFLDPTGSGNWTDVAASSLSYRDYGTSSMYDETGKVMITGGNPREGAFAITASTATIYPSRITEVIDPTQPTPAWRRVPDMNIGRRHATSTILPDGNVLVTGGSSSPGFNTSVGAALWAELWDPTTEQWTPMAAASVYNGYHCNAVLLPDGRVVTTGGGHPNAPETEVVPPNFGSLPFAEIYSPYYLFNGPRPTITTAPDRVTYGESFHIGTPDGEQISGVSMIRLGASTHAFNQSQRINFLSFTNTGGGLQIEAPESPFICTPGPYMLFLLNSNSVPSVAAVLNIGMGILSVTNQANINFVTVTTVPDNRYQVEFSDVVPVVTWTRVGGPATAVDVTTTVADVGGAAFTNRFYRVRRVP
jgi:hypothetical protein